MSRWKTAVLLLIALVAGNSGCTVDVGLAASNAVQGVLNSLIADLVADLVNGLLPV